jgi:hypothetical protein
MWERIGRRNAKRSGGAAAPLSGALGRMGGPLGRQETKHTRTSHGRPVRLGLLGALALVATVSIVLVVRRRAARRDIPVEEEANEESAGAVVGNDERMKAEGSIEREGDTTEGHKEYYRRVIRESMERSGLS